jgi:DNA primase
MDKFPEEFLQKIVDSIDLLSYVSQHIDMDKYGKNYFGLCPFHREDSGSFSIPDGGDYYYCHGCKKSGNIIRFVMEYDNISFPSAVEKLHSIVGNIEFTENKSKTFKFLKNTSKIMVPESKEINRDTLSIVSMDKYKKITIQEWVDEGISQRVMDKYNVRYDDKAQRIVFPVWDNYGNMISIKGRTTVKNWKELGLKKYIYYTPIHTNDFLWGYCQKKDIIQHDREVIVFEGSKSVMKVESWGVLNAVSVETSSVNYEQIRTLAAMRVNIVLALDKGVDIKRISREIQPLKRFTNVYFILDTKGLLDNKESPCDSGHDIFKELQQQKIKL